jgi:hypothetical protein
VVLCRIDGVKRKFRGRSNMNGGGDGVLGIANAWKGLCGTCPSMIDDDEATEL